MVRPCLQQCGSEILRVAFNGFVIFVQLLCFVHLGPHFPPSFPQPLKHHPSSPPCLLFPLGFGRQFRWMVRFRSPHCHPQPCKLKVSSHHNSGLPMGSRHANCLKSSHGQGCYRSEQCPQLTTLRTQTSKTACFEMFLLSLSRKLAKPPPKWIWPSPFWRKWGGGRWRGPYVCQPSQPSAPNQYPLPPSQPPTFGHPVDCRRLLGQESRACIPLTPVWCPSGGMGWWVL